MNLIIKLLIILSLFSQSKTADHQHRDFLLFYQSNKYSIPKRQVIISVDQSSKLNFQSGNNNIATDNNKNIKPNNGDIIFRDYDDDNNNHTELKQIPLSEGSLSEGSLSEGSFCRRSFDGLSGYCILAYQCLHIVREFRKHGTKIDICSYQNNIPVICCPLEEKFVKNYQQSISSKKCAEFNNLNINLQRRKYDNQTKKCVSSVPLIVGGERTYPGEYPHMAAIGWTKLDGNVNWACGGTLISEQYILTAAHCTKFGGKPPDHVRLGDQNLYSDNDDAEPVDIKIINIHIHPKYKKKIYYHDIALLKLENPVNFTKFIHPACLWDNDLTNDMKIITATGWGRTKFLGPKSHELLKVDLEIIDNDMCNQLYDKETNLPNGITNQQFCAGYLQGGSLKGGKDTCQGDSGGPMNFQMPKHNCVKYIIGITSFGKNCATANAPGVYIKISAYLDWIEDIVFKE